MSVQPRAEWSQAELNQIHELKGQLSARAIGAGLGRSRNAVKLKMSRIGLCVERAPRWTDAELDVLRESALTMTCIQTAKQLGRTRQTVHWKAAQLGIKFAKKQAKARKRPLRFWTDSELIQLRELAGSLSQAELARQIGKSVDAVEHMARKLGLRVGYTKQPQGVAARPKIKPRPAPGRKIEPTMITVPRVVYCEVCSAPVVGTFSGWASHYERVGCNRKAKRA